MKKFAIDVIMRGEIYMALNLKNDIGFKAFFSRKGNEKFLREFLEALLKIQIKDIIITEEVSLEKLFAEEKGGRLDLLAILNNNMTVDIEMQVKKQPDFIERTTMYGSKLLAQQIGSGMDYKQVNQTILINILDFNLLNVKDYLSETEIVLKKHKDYIVMKNPKWYFIELPKFRKIKPNLENKLEQWLLFMDDYDKEGIKMAESKNRTLKEARKMMDFLTGGDELKRLREKWEIERNWDRQIAESRGEQRGERKGKKAGMKQAQLEIARKLLSMGKSVAEIIEITGLKKEEIESLKQQ